jgi:tripartite-type tricarboxylate transporter receptor subunit TctC
LSALVQACSIFFRFFKKPFTGDSPMIRRRLTLLALLCAPLMAWSQAYPSKPIRLVVPYAPGGAVDSLARPVAQKLSEILGQPVIVDNRPGANATLGADNVARSSPDGYSLVLTSIVHYLVPFFSKAVPYDTMKDFTPIAQMAITPNILAVHPSMPVNSIKELIDYAKKNPGKLFYGTTGVGSTHHLGGVLFAQMANISLEHLPYKGGSPTINDALGGQIPVVILTSTTAPVEYEDASDTNQAMAWATSSARPARFMGTKSLALLARSASPAAA